MLSLKGILNVSGTTNSGLNEFSQSALQWMASLQEEWILVFDNADSAPEVVENFIPPGHRGNVLITSRNRSLGRLTQFENSLEIENMEKEDAISLLLKASGHTGQAEPHLWKMAENIVTELCFLPLAVAQAGASIEAGLCDIHDYLLQFSAKRKELLSYSSFKGASKYYQTVYGTWELSFKEIETRASRGSTSHDVQSAQIAILIFQIFAFMHYESIDENIFEHVALNIRDNKDQLPQILGSTAESRLLCCDKNSRWDKFYFRMGIQILQSFSLIKRRSDENSYSVHPLIHSWNRDRQSQSEQHINFYRAMTILSCSISFSYKTQDYIFRQRLIPHIKASYHYAAELDIKKEYDDNRYSKFGLVFRENGDWAEAENLDIQVMKTRNEMLGQEHPDTLSSMSNLASTYWNQGRWNEAEQLEIQVMDLSKRVLGQEHPHTLTSTSNLASTYLNQGRWNEAEQLQNQVMDLRKRVLGQEHPHTLTSMSNIASTYLNQGRWIEAEKLEIQVMDLRKRVLGQEHPHTLSSMSNLASTYLNQGRWNKAEQLQNQVMELSKRVLGQEHPHTLTSMSNLASTYWNQRRWNEAEQLDIQVMDLSKRVLGQEHPDTLSSMGNLASTYLNQGRWNKAEQLQNQVMDLRKRVLGQEHPDTLSSMSNLASTYWNQGRWNEAEQLEIQVMDLRKRVLGQEHPDTLSNMSNLASTYWNQGR